MLDVATVKEELDQVPTVYETLRPVRPDPIATLLRSPAQWQVNPRRLAAVVLMVVALPVSALVLIARAFIFNSLTLFWWGVGVAVLWLLLAIIVGTVRLWSDVRHSVHDVMDTMVTVSQRETKILEQLLLLPLRTLRHATQQLEQRVGVLEQNVSLLLGGVRQGGVLAIVLSLTAGYIGIAKEVGVAKQASGVLLGTAVGFTIAAFLVNDLLTSLHLRLSILKRAVVLRQEIADPPS